MAHKGKPKSGDKKEPPKLGFMVAKPKPGKGDKDKDDK